MLRRIGDVLLTLPAVRSLRSRFPEAEIDFLVEPPAHELLAGNPDITRLIVLGSKGPANLVYLVRRLRAQRYDWVVDFMGNPRTAIFSFLSGAALRAGPARVSHRWAYTHLLRQPEVPCYSALEKIRTLRGLGLEPDERDFLPRIAPQAVDRDFAAAALRGLGLEPGRPLIAFAPASRRITRQWPERHYAELGRLLRDRRGAELLILWGRGEEAVARSVQGGIGSRAYLSPETKDLRRLAGLIASCRMLVTNCSGPKHIAVALSVPTLTIHSSSDPRAWTPPGIPLHAFIRKEDLHCIGCRLNECPYALECLRDLPAAEVFAAAERLLAATEPGGPAGGPV
ncbi:MAG: hypothetical protein A2X36_16240 [Elusimicrobia bacterium GWA2_69_24]|nr:MAG: hypothetical protein A2X36_16240 [Elusimicrobia bacterium GWA2_69_24]